MNDHELLAYMKSLDLRVANIESDMGEMKGEFGELKGTMKPSMIPVLVKYVIFPLIIILGGLVGVKIFLPL